MKKLYKSPAAFSRLVSLLGIIAIGAVITLGLAGCSNPTGPGGDGRPAELGNSATASQALTALDALIAYSETPAETRAEAQALREQRSTYNSGDNWASLKTSVIGQINTWIGALPEGGSGGGVIDSALVATWHSTQAAADEGDDVVFEFRADGNFILASGAMAEGATAKAVTSNGRISATLTASGYTIDWGSADYAVNGTRLKFSNFSTGYNYFQILMQSLEQIDDIVDADPYFYKSGGGSSSGGEDVFKGTWVSNDNFIRLVASNGSFKEYLANNKEVVRGTYTISGNTVTATIEEINTAMFDGADTWVTWEKLSDSYKGHIGGAETQKLTILNGNTFVSAGKIIVKQDKPAELPNNTTKDDALAVLDEILDNPDIPDYIKEAAQDIIDQSEGVSGDNWEAIKKQVISEINDLIDDIPATITVTVTGIPTQQEARAIN
jgi:hypothetical protein